jgi:hypothetical protein
LIFFVFSIYLSMSGMTVARIYCNRETRQAFRMIWSGWLNALENATGQRLRIKPIHREGSLGTMLMDGSVPQIQGLGDALRDLHYRCQRNCPMGCTHL